MKRILMVLATVLLAATSGPAQDAATQERLDKLAGHIEDLVAAQKAQQRQISEITRELERLRDAASKPKEAYATQEDVKRLTESVREVDRKRLEDAERVRKELASLSTKLLSSPPPSGKTKAPATAKTENTAEKSSPPEKFFEYKVEKGDTLSSIVAAYRDQNIKVTVDQVLKANPGLKLNSLKVGQTIIIPAP